MIAKSGNICYNEKDKHNKGLMYEKFKRGYQNRKFPTGISSLWRRSIPEKTI